MAMQPVDRQKAKHKIKTAPRSKPQHEAPRYWGWHRGIHW
jgi:hypothetical protein